MLYDAARDAAVEQCDSLRDELREDIHDLQSSVERHDSRLDEVEDANVALEQRVDDLSTIREDLLDYATLDQVDERLTAHPTHDDLDHQIDRINALERNLQGFDNVADCNQIADLNVRVNALERLCDERTAHRHGTKDVEGLGEALNMDDRSLSKAHELIGTLMDAVFDTASSASRQHYIDTGRYLTHAEVAEDAEPNDFTARRGIYANPISTEQRRTIFGLLKGLGWTHDLTYGGGGRQRRISVVQAILNREQPYTSFTQLSESDAEVVIVALLQANRIKEALA